MIGVKPLPSPDVRTGDSARIAACLSEAVVGRVFPALLRAIATAAPAPRPDNAAWRAEVREAALRLLFLFYAEDRGLLAGRSACST